MADKNARNQAIKRASSRVKSGSGWTSRSAVTGRYAKQSSARSTPRTTARDSRPKK